MRTQRRAPGPRYLIFVVHLDSTFLSQQSRSLDPKLSINISRVEVNLPGRQSWKDLTGADRCDVDAAVRQQGLPSSLGTSGLVAGLGVLPRPSRRAIRGLELDGSCVTPVVTPVTSLVLFRRLQQRPQNGERPLPSFDEPEVHPINLREYHRQ